MPSPERPAAPISLFYSYSHEDEALRNKLETHLSLLQDEGVISGWHDRRIEAGTEWDGAISRNLEEAGIILLLVSADFLASRYCSGRRDQAGDGAARGGDGPGHPGHPPAGRLAHRPVRQAPGPAQGRQGR